MVKCPQCRSKKVERQNSTEFLMPEYECNYCGNKWKEKITEEKFLEEILSSQGVFLPFLEKPVKPVEEYKTDDERCMVKLEGNRRGKYRLVHDTKKIIINRLGTNYWGKV